jgi:phosphoserine phosphatase RsbU/P
MTTSTQEFKILVADDSRVYRKLVEETLGREQYAVCFAKDGREASDLLAEHRPALVITDWDMPGLTGIELCGKIRSDRGLTPTSSCSRAT